MLAISGIRWGFTDFYETPLGDFMRPGWENILRDSAGRFLSNSAGKTF